MGAPLLGLLRQARVCPPGQLTSLEELGFAGDLADETWMTALGERGANVVITRDGNILNAEIRRRAWQQSGIGLIVLDKKWGGLTTRDLSRYLLYWWPVMTGRTIQGGASTAWTVAGRIHEPLADWMRPIAASGSL